MDYNGIDPLDPGWEIDASGHRRRPDGYVSGPTDRIIDQQIARNHEMARETKALPRHKVIISGQQPCKVCERIREGEPIEGGTAYENIQGHYPTPSEAKRRLTQCAGF